MKLHRKLIAIATAGLLAVSVTACESVQANKQTGGAVLGAVGGGLAGSAIGGGSGRLVAVGVGTLLGALIGSEVGKSLDRADVAAMERTNQTALETAPTGQATAWRNPDSGSSGTITPVRTTQTASGQYCREYQQTVTVAGKSESAYGTACRQPDGSWKVVN